MRRRGALRAISLGAVALLVMAGTRIALAQPGKSDPVKRFTEVAVEIGGTVFWLPNTIEVNQGDRVVITAKDLLGGPPEMHGFAIPAYHVAVLVPMGQTKTVTFTADKAGIFPFICQIHSDHIGGQLVVHPPGAFGKAR